MFIRRLLNCVMAATVSAFFLAGCSVDSSQIRFGNVYEWKQAEAYGENSFGSSNSRRARSIAHITDNFPAPIEQTGNAFFPLTAARLSLGSFAESETSDTDYLV